MYQERAQELVEGDLCVLLRALLRHIALSCIQATVTSDLQRVGYGNFQRRNIHVKELRILDSNPPNRRACTLQISARQSQ